MSSCRYLFLFFITIFLSINSITSIPGRRRYVLGSYSSPPQNLYGALEAGGTKMVCAVLDTYGNVIKQETIPTTIPEETVPKMLKFFLPINLPH